ncbi:MAG: TonB-dependent receptor [Ignavibacteria bacterium]|nr:TonB-dependent receptor [Ignavibacteria bacterium]
MKKYLFVVIISIFSFVVGLSQDKIGGISGKVTDKMNQQPVQGVVVEIIGQKIKTGTDDNGFYYFESVPQGTYSVRFSSIGYQLFVADNIVVNSGVITDVTVSLSIIETDEIAVEDERFTKPGDISTSIKNLSFEEIRRTPGGFEDVGRVVQTLPGVSFVNDGRNDLIVRGGSPSENLFIVDNSYVPNINHFGSQGATGGPVSIINLGFIRDVNFITGGFSAKYGDKLSSVLEIKQREGSRIKFMTDINLSATGFGAVLEGPIGSNKKGSWLISANRSYLDFIFNAAGFGFVPEYYSFQAKGVYDLNKHNFLTINLIGNLDNVKFNNDDEKKKQDNSIIIGSDQKGYVTGIELKSLLSRKSYSIINLTRTFTDYNYSGRNIEQILYFNNVSKEGETSLKAEYNLQVIKTGQLTAGIEGKLVNFRNEILKDSDTLYFINPETNSRYILPAINLNNTTNTYKGAAFVQWTQFVATRLKLNFGLRYDYFDFIEKKNYISPRASASLNVIHDLYLNLSYGIYYQSPSYIWLISNEQNRKLEDIRTDHYIAGLEYIIMPDLKVSVEAYYKKYDKYPVSTARPYYIFSNNGGNFDNQNNFGLEPLNSAGTGYSKGMELFIQKTLSKNYYFNISLSLFTAKYKSLDGIERESDFNNRYLFTAYGGYLFGDGWQVSSKFRYTGGRPYTPINPENGIQLVSDYNTSHLPDYYSLDMRLDKKWSFRKWTLVTYIDIQDITGRKNVTAYQWNKYTRVIDTKNGIGLLPSIGVNAMF